MNEQLKKIKQDLKAYADNPEDVIVDELSGDILFTRFRRDISIKLKPSRDGNIYVEHNEKNILYKEFLIREVAQLEIFAENLIKKHNKKEHFYIDSKAELNTPYEKIKDLAINLIKKSCEPNFSSKVTFVTADAGHGKTSLLKQFESQQAQKFLDGNSSFLFWHIDLQGRQLVRLNEAIMADLGELRLSGLYMSSIYNLIQHGALIIAIDGFDELSAEQGASESLGALAHLVQKLEGKGAIIAASRRTFFDNDDYIKKARVFDKIEDCSFNELKLNNWGKEECLEYLKLRDNLSSNYDEIVSILKNDEHRFITQPFLFTKVVDGFNKYKITPTEFLSSSDSLDGISRIVESFIDREVKDKWKFSDTNEPYLTKEQHLELLSLVAGEMWDLERESIPLEDLEFITKLFCEGCNIEDKKQRQIFNMVGMHALLLPEYRGIEEYRRFEHPEFKNYFIAENLVYNFKSEKTDNLKRFISKEQLPSEVALYACAKVNNNINREAILFNLETILAKEWKPTYSQINVGTIIPYLLNNYSHSNNIIFGETLDEISSKVIYSSLIFEDKKINNTTFYFGNFINVSFKNTNFKKVNFINCEFNELKIIKDTVLFDNVTVKNCNIKSIIILDNENEILEHEFSPVKIPILLKSLGILDLSYFKNDEKVSDNLIKEDSAIKKLAKRFLNMFRKTNLIPEYGLTSKFGNKNAKFKSHEDYNNLINDIIPLMKEYEIIEEAETKRTKMGGNSGQQTKAWKLLVTIDDIFKANAIEDNSKYSNFWKKIDEKQVQH